MTKNSKLTAGDAVDPATTADVHETRPTKIGAVLALLQRDEGAALGEITEATGWQKHTARAALTGLKKKGHTIGKAKVDGSTRYTIVAGARS